MKLSASHEKHLDDVLHWRRDVRHFRTDAIEPAVLSRIEAAVDSAPSVGNSHPWRVVRVIDRDIRKSIIDCYKAENEAASKIYDNDERLAYLELKLAGLIDAPTHLAFFTDLSPEEGRGLGRQTMPETLEYSTVMAIHTLWLAARALNVGVGWVSILDPDAITKVLDVPKGWKLTGYLCVGYPKAFDDTPELARKGWQANTKTIWLDR